MARKLQINVQIDRLPDIPGKTGRYFGVRLSACIAPDPPDRAASEDLLLLLPWRWTGADLTTIGSWNPAQSTSWKAWWVDPRGAPGPPHPPAPIDPNRVTPLVNSAVVSVDFLGAWTDALRTTVDRLANDPVGFEKPMSAASANGRGGPVAGPTLFGFVESLSPLPAPWPEIHKVWTCLRIDLPPPDEGYELVVAPAFGAPNIAFYDLHQVPPIDSDWLDPARTDHRWIVHYDNVQSSRIQPPLEAWACVDRLMETSDVGQRILLEDQFLIKKGDWTRVSDDDWMTQLPARIADILDPPRAFTQAVERLLPQYVAAQATPVQSQTDAQKALLAAVSLPANAGDRNALRNLLAATWWRVLARCATGTRAITPFQVALASAKTTSAEKDDIRNLLAGLTARDAAETDVADKAFKDENPHCLSDARLLALMGLQPEDATPSDGPSVDSGDGLRTFLVHHWAAPPGWGAAATVADEPAAPLLSTSLMQCRAATWDSATRSTLPDPDNARPLLDLTGLKSARSVKFKLRNAGTPVSVTVFLWLDAIRPDPPLSVAIQIPSGDCAVTVTVAPGNPPAVKPQLAVALDGGASATQDLSEAVVGRRAFLTLRAPNRANVQVTGADIPEDLVRQLLARTSDAALRASASLAYAAPFLPSILGGAGPNGAQVSAGASPPDAITAAVKAWTRDRFSAECTAAIRFCDDPVGNVPANVAKLFHYIAESTAIELADLQAGKLFAALAAGDARDYAVSGKATPIVFPIDQPQPIADAQDLWSMFAGVGVLAGVSTDGTNRWPDGDAWFSLNAALMSARGDASNPAPVVFPLFNPSPFDPVPMQIGELGGVRAANVAYENRSLVGQMPHEQILPELSSGGRSTPRRIDLYSFPDSSFKLKLPALSFGKRYFFLPYLIGHGGALPVCLRDASNKEIATNLRSKSDGILRVKEAEVGDDLHQTGGTAQDLVRFADYRRTVPIGTPRIEGSLPGVPDGVEPLASEIPISPSAITIGAGETVFFYCNQDRTAGILDFSQVVATTRAIQVDFAGLPKGSDQTERPELQVVFEGHGVVLPPLVIPGDFWPTDRSLGVRLVVASDGATLYAQQNRELDDPFVERPPAFATPRNLVTGSIDLTGWEAFFIKVANPTGVDATLLPPVVTTGAGGGPAGLDRPRAFPLPEAAHQKRIISVLDGIGPSSSGSAVELAVRRPAVEFSTFERWVNWDLSDEDSANALDEAHVLVSQVAAGAGGVNKDLTLDDPAVEDVVVELVALFPYPQTHGRRAIGLPAWSKKDEIARGFGLRPPMAGRMRIQVGAGPNIEGQPGKVTITLDPGGVFEVRLYGAAREEPQSLFNAKPPAPASRFGKGVWQGMLGYAADGTRYRLGAPLALTFEVATARMPTLYGPKPASSIDRVLDPTGGAQDRADIAFRRDFILRRDEKTDELVNYPFIRYVSLISLYSQRWGWRGRSLGTLPALPVQDKGQRLRGELGDFETIAFLDRRDDDVGVIEEAKLTLGHVMPAVDSSGAVQEPPSLLFRKDLQYRGAPTGGDSPSGRPADTRRCIRATTVSSGSATSRPTTTTTGTRRAGTR